MNPGARGADQCQGRGGDAASDPIAPCCSSECPLSDAERLDAHFAPA